MTDTTHEAPKPMIKGMDRLTQIDQLKLHVLNDLSEPCLDSLLNEIEELEAERDALVRCLNGLENLTARDAAIVAATLAAIKEKTDE